MRANDRPETGPQWMRWVEKEIGWLKSGGRSGPFFKLGQTAVTFDGAGNTTLTHDFGQVPTVVFATHLTGGTNIVIAPTTGTLTDTQVVLHARNLDGTVFVGGTTVLWQVGI